MAGLDEVRFGCPDAEVPNARRFSLENRVLADAVGGEVRTAPDGIVRLVIHCLDASARPDPECRRLLNYAKVELPFDFGVYWGLGRDERSSMALDALVEGALLACSEFGWDAEQFVAAAAKIRAAGYVLEYPCGKRPVLSERSVKVRREARLWVRLDRDSARVMLRLVDRGSGEEREFLLIDDPGFWDYFYVQGKLSWVDRETVEIDRSWVRGTDPSRKEPIRIAWSDCVPIAAGS